MVGYKYQANHLFWCWVFLLFQILRPSKHYSVLCYPIFCTVVKLGGDFFLFCLDLRDSKHFPVARIMNLYDNRSANVSLQTAGLLFLVTCCIFLGSHQQTAAVPMKTIAQVTSYAHLSVINVYFKSFMSKSDLHISKVG